MTNLQPAPESIKSLTKYTNLYFQREDLNPNGSFKDRALSYQIKYLKENNIDCCVISSSGNAAIAAADHCRKNNIKCIILISPDTDPAKLSQIIHRQPDLLIKSTNARRLANYIHKKYNIYLLNPSKDNRAITGFESLGQDIHQSDTDCQIIFSYVTSGASLLGMISYYQKLAAIRPIIFPHFIGVQSGQQTWLAHDVFGQVIEKKCQQLAGRNALSKTPRSKQIYTTLNQPFPKPATNLPVIQQPPYEEQQILNSIGRIYWVNEETILKNYELLHQNNINSSFEGAAALAAAIDFCRQYPDLKNAVAIISGREHEIIQNPDFIIHPANTKKDIDQLLTTFNENN